MGAFVFVSQFLVPFMHPGLLIQLAAMLTNDFDHLSKKITISTDSRGSYLEICKNIISRSTSATPHYAILLDHYPHQGLVRLLQKK